MTRIRFTERPYIRNPWADFEKIRQGMDQLSQNYFHNDVLFHKCANVYPPLNIFETDETIIIKAEIPGVTAENLDISIEQKSLSLMGTRELLKNDRDLSYHRREIPNGSFNRSVVLPTKVDLENTSATLKNGILTITLNKAAEVKPRCINVTVME